MARYAPPLQARLGQVLDVGFLLVMILGALFVPLRAGLVSTARSAGTGPQTPAWQDLGRTEGEVAQYQALGLDPAAAQWLILGRLDTGFSATSVLLMLGLIVCFYVLLLNLTDAEYRDQITEKFGRK